MFLSAHAAKVPQKYSYLYTCISEQGLYHHLGWTSRTQHSTASADCWSCAGFVLLSCLSSFFIPSPFFPLSTTFNFASSQSTLSFLPLSPMCHTGQGRPPVPLLLHSKRDSTLSCCPLGSTIFHVRAANGYKGRKRSACFPGPFSHFICRYRHISGVLSGRIKGRSFPTLTLLSLSSNLLSNTLPSLWAADLTVKMLEED